MGAYGWERAGVSGEVGGGEVGRGDHERSTQEKGAQGGWVAEKTDSFWALLLLRVSII